MSRSSNPRRSVSKTRLWSAVLARFQPETDLAITACHFSPGTSKWEKIQHRLFSHISMTWRGRPRESHEIIVELIGATTTRRGLRVRAALDRRAYPLGAPVSDHGLTGTGAAARVARQLEVRNRAPPTVASAITGKSSSNRPSGKLAGRLALSADNFRAMTTDYPLSAPQAAIWEWMGLLAPTDRGSFTLWNAFRLNGRLNVHVLHQCLNELLARHAVLRSQFPEVSGRLAPVISPRISLELPLVDLSSLPVDRRQLEAERLVREEVEHPFNLGTDPLVRAMILRLSVDEHVFVTSMHHLVGDAWSSRIFWRELSALYGAFSMGQPSPLPPATLQYPDFCRWQEEYLRGERFRQRLTNWKRRLRGFPSCLDLPTRCPRESLKTISG
jgi:Condensation domain/Rhodopirellula transposase DDE domain